MPEKKEKVPDNLTAPLRRELNTFYAATKRKYDQAPATGDEVKKILEQAGVKAFFSDKAWSCLSSFDGFAPSLDGLGGSTPSISRQFWGCVRYLFVIVSRKRRYLESVSKMFDTMGGFTSQELQIKLEIRSSPAVQAKLPELYARCLLRCCTTAITVILSKRGKILSTLKGEPRSEMFNMLCEPLERFQPARVDFITTLRRKSTTQTQNQYDHQEINETNDHRHSSRQVPRECL